MHLLINPRAGCRGLLRIEARIDKQPPAVGPEPAGLVPPYQLLPGGVCCLRVVIGLDVTNEHRSRQVRKEVGHVERVHRRQDKDDQSQSGENTAGDHPAGAAP